MIAVPEATFSHAAMFQGASNFGIQGAPTFNAAARDIISYYNSKRSALSLLF